MPIRPVRQCHRLLPPHSAHADGGGAPVGRAWTIHGSGLQCASPGLLSGRSCRGCGSRCRVCRDDPCPTASRSVRVSRRHVPRLLARFGVRDHRHSSSALGIERCRRAETSPGIHTSRYPCSEPSSPADNARKQEDERVAFQRGGAALLLATVRAAEVLLSLRTREAGRGSRANRHFRVERPLRQRIRNMRGKTRKHVRNMFKRGSCKALVAKAPVARQTT